MKRVVLIVGGILVAALALALAGGAADEGACGLGGKECHPTLLGTLIVVLLPVPGLGAFLWAWWSMRRARRR
jgi:hypothetical protein